MTTLKTSELTGAALDWAVAKAEGGTHFWSDGWAQSYLPSTDWAQGGPIIERERINVSVYASLNWMATMNVEKRIESGPTPLIAAMRCYVASKLGYEVDVPPALI